jgi:hypothetical protein
MLGGERLREHLRGVGGTTNRLIKSQNRRFLRILSKVLTIGPKMLTIFPKALTKLLTVSTFA